MTRDEERVWAQRAAASIAAEEDRRILDILEMIGRGPTCEDMAHRRKGDERLMIPCEDCHHTDCVVRGVVES